MSTNAECGLDLEEECKDCILTLKLSLEPDVCEDVDSTVSVFESGSKTPIEGAVVKILSISDNSTQVLSNHLACPTGNETPCGEPRISKEGCTKRGCCFAKLSNQTVSCFQKIETRAMITDMNGLLVTTCPGDAKLKVSVEKESYEALKGIIDVFCQHPCDSCNPSLTVTLMEETCKNGSVPKTEVTVTDEE